MHRAWHNQIQFLIDGYYLQNKIDEAIQIIIMMALRVCSPNVISYSILIYEYCKSKIINETKNLFVKMSSKRMIPDIITYTSLIGRFCQVGRLHAAL